MMTAADFRAWCQRAGHDATKRQGQLAIASLLAASRGEVSAWQSGGTPEKPRPVPRRIAAMCVLRERNNDWAPL